jgi:hypothetical protein
MRLGRAMGAAVWDGPAALDRLLEVAAVALDELALSSSVSIGSPRDAR